MHAQVIETQVGPGRVDVLERLVRYELLPALREEAGFCGAVSLLDRDRSQTLVVLLWETEEEAARPLQPFSAPFLKAFATVTELLGADACSATTWEINARG
jgi:hypothetical protein